MSGVRRLSSSRRSLWVRRGFITAASLSATYLVTDRMTDYSLTRSLRTLYAFARIAYLYKYTSPTSLAEYSALHRRSAQIVLQLCLINEGLYIKIGQALNAMSHILPYEYTDTLKVLLDAAPSVPLSEIRHVIRVETGSELEELFDDFDPVPVASASIAQVHRARLKATGYLLKKSSSGQADDNCDKESRCDWVAVKVQKPHIRTQSKWDLRTYQLISILVQAVFGLPTKWSRQTIVDGLQREMDFTLEAANARRMRAYFRHDPHVYIPCICEPYTTSRLLVMEWIDGVKLLHVPAVRAEFDSTAVLRTVFDALGKMIFEYGFVHCDLHPANVLVRHRWHTKLGKDSHGDKKSAHITDSTCAIRHSYNTVHNTLGNINEYTVTDNDGSSSSPLAGTHSDSVHAVERGRPSWWRRLVPFQLNDQTNFEVVLLDFGLCISETERFRMQYALLYRSIFTHDITTLSRILNAWGISDAETFVSIQMQKPLRSIQAGHYDEVTAEEMREIQRAARDRAQHLLRNVELIPRELPLVGRGVDILRGVNRLYGSPVNRLNMFITSAVRCLGPLHDYDGVTRYLDRLRLRTQLHLSADAARQDNNTRDSVCKDERCTNAVRVGRGSQNDTHNSEGSMHTTDSRMSSLSSGTDNESTHAHTNTSVVARIDESFVSVYDRDAEAFRAAQSDAARELMQEEKASAVLVLRHAIQSVHQRFYFYSILTYLAVVHTMTLWYNAALNLLPLSTHLRQRLRARTLEDRIDRLSGGSGMDDAPS